MIDVVTAENRALYTAQLKAMHADRKRVFVDRLKWDLPVVDGSLEVDRFDGDGAAYLVALDEDRRRHLGSVRLLPTTRPHILSAAFPDLCAGEVPVGPDIWEITRFCVSPSVTDDSSTVRVRRALAIAMVEFALLYEIRSYTFVTHLSWLPRILSLGWDADPLGLPKGAGREAIGAARLTITPATLSLFREQWDFRQPVLRLDLDTCLAA